MLFPRLNIVLCQLCLYYQWFIKANCIFQTEYFALIKSMFDVHEFIKQGM